MQEAGDCEFDWFPPDSCTWSQWLIHSSQFFVPLAGCQVAAEAANSRSILTLLTRGIGIGGIGMCLISDEFVGNRDGLKQKEKLKVLEIWLAQITRDHVFEQLQKSKVEWNYTISTWSLDIYTRRPGWFWWDIGIVSVTFSPLISQTHCVAGAGYHGWQHWYLADVARHEQIGHTPQIRNDTSRSEMTSAPQQRVMPFRSWLEVNQHQHSQWPPFGMSGAECTELKTHVQKFQ